MKIREILKKLKKVTIFDEDGRLKYLYDPIRGFEYNGGPCEFVDEGTAAIHFTRHNQAVLLKHDKITWIIRNGLEMWFDENEELIRARWANGYEQEYKDGKIFVVSEAYK